MEMIKDLRFKIKDFLDASSVNKAQSSIFNLQSLIIYLVFMIFLPLNSPFAQENLTIDRCVSMALRNNEQILKAEQALAEAKGTLTVIHSDEYLQMDFTTSYQRTKSGEGIETRAYNGTLRADQLLARFGGVPKRLDAAQEKYRMAELALQSARVDVVSRTRQIFYDIVLIQDEMKERKILRDEIEKKRVRTEERVSNKLALELDLLDVELELAQQELRINELKRELNVKKAELSQVIGADEEAELIISGELPVEELMMDACIKTAVANRVELKDIKGQIKRQDRILQEVRWNRLPELKSSYRYKDTSITLEQEDSTWSARASYEKPIWEKQEEKQNKWEFSFGFGFPIYDGFRIKGVMEEENARLESLKLNLIQQEKQVRLEVRSAYQEMVNEKENMDIQSRLVTLRRKTLERMEAIMETPVISEKYPRLAGITFDDVIRAREDYTEAQRLYFAQKRNYMIAREKLRQVMGVTIEH